MKNEPGSREELFEDLKEQLLFLKEIGVDGLRADLPERTETDEPEITHSDFQTYVPRKSELVSKQKPQTDRSASTPPASGKGDVLRSIRLSDMQKSNVHGTTEARSAPPEPQQTTVRKDAAPEIISSPEPSIPELSPGLPDADENLEDVRADIGKDCTRCRLCEKRTQVVNSVGDANADLMFIGEAPGADEDLQGEPFVGRAGQLLTKIIEAIDLKREDVFIGNINRCRPPDNRRPLPDEASVCKPFLLREIAIVRPKVIVVLGNTACHNLLDTRTGITRLRGKFLDYFGIKVMPTFHPAYLLRDPRKKREVWEDMKMVRDELNRLNGSAG